MLMSWADLWFCRRKLNLNITGNIQVKIQTKASQPLRNLLVLMLTLWSAD